jgi:hypothetical protein
VCFQRFAPSGIGVSVGRSEFIMIRAIRTIKLKAKRC